MARGADDWDRKGRGNKREEVEKEEEEEETSSSSVSSESELGASSSYDDDSSSGEDEDEEAILEEMSQIPFDVLMKAREEGSGGAASESRSRQKYSTKSSSSSRIRVTQSNQRIEKGPADNEDEVPKKRGKHMPKEISSKRTYNPFKDSELKNKRRKRDPRFDRNVEQGDQVHARARKNYSFVFDDLIPEEERKIKASLKKVKAESSRQRLQKKLKRLQGQVEQHKSEKRKDERKREMRTKTSTGKNGKKFFLKRSEVKKQLLLDKYNELKKKGKLDDYLAKKRRRNASKEHKNIPFNRRQA